MDDRKIKMIIVKEIVIRKKYEELRTMLEKFEEEPRMFYKRYKNIQRQKEKIAKDKAKVVLEIVKKIENDDSLIMFDRESNFIILKDLVKPEYLDVIKKLKYQKVLEYSNTVDGKRIIYMKFISFSKFPKEVA